MRWFRKLSTEGRKEWVQKPGTGWRSNDDKQALLVCGPSLAPQFGHLNSRRQERLLDGCNRFCIGSNGLHSDLAIPAMKLLQVASNCLKWLEFVNVIYFSLVPNKFATLGPAPSSLKISESEIALFVCKNGLSFVQWTVAAECYSVYFALNSRTKLQHLKYLLARCLVDTAVVHRKSK